MSKFDEAVDKYKDALSTNGLMNTVNEDLLKKVAKSLGPSIYLADASLVSCSDQVELDRVKNNFLIKKLGMADGSNLDDAIKGVCEKYKASRQKHRAVFYYMLVEMLGMQDKF
jgi:Protein of unknown function (DUF2853)